MARAPLARMHLVLFQMKRAYHSTLKFGHRLLKDFGLTPARFDLLYVIMQRWWHYGSQRRNKEGRNIRQYDIRRELGVSAPTVSRMLDSLEDLGLVRREEVEHDRRHRYVHPTVLCRKIMTLAAGLLVESGFSDLMVRSIFVPERWFDLNITREVLTRFVLRLRAVRFAAHDYVQAWGFKDLYSDTTFQEPTWKASSEFHRIGDFGREVGQLG